MTSPFSFSGTLRVGATFASVDAALAAVEQALREVKVGHVQSDHQKITFRATARAAWSIGPISSGEIAFSSTATGIVVRYWYSWFGQFVFMTSCFILLAVIGLSSSKIDGLILSLFLLPVGLCVVGARYFMIRKLFPRFLAHAIGAHLPQPPARSEVGDPFPDY